MEELLAAVRELRLQRRATVAAIRAVETVARERGDLIAFSDMLNLYLCSTNVTTVDELRGIEGEAHAYLRALQGRSSRGRLTPNSP